MKKEKTYPNLGVPISKNRADADLIFTVTPHTCPNCRSKKIILDKYFFEDIFPGIEKNNQIVLPFHCSKCKLVFDEVYQYNYSKEYEDE